MRYQVQQAGVALQVGAQVSLPVNDAVKIFNLAIVAAAKIQAGYL